MQRFMGRKIWLTGRLLLAPLDQDKEHHDEQHTSHHANQRYLVHGFTPRYSESADFLLSTQNFAQISINHDGCRSQEDDEKIGKDE